MSDCIGGGIARLLDEWAEARALLAEIERREHPDIVDDLGRTWTWWKGDLYRHDRGFAWPREHVLAPGQRPPSDAVVRNSGYDLCDICLAGRAA